MDNYVDNDITMEKEVRKAKRNIILIFLLMFLLIFVICPFVIYSVYDGIFPKAEKFDYPDYSLIESITVSKDGEQIYLSDEECRVLYEYIRTSISTRIMSANETPDVTPFLKVEIKSNDISFYGHGYIYIKKMKHFILKSHMLGYINFWILV